MMACNVILSVWQVLALFHAKKIDSSQIRSLADLSEWIQGMIRAMLVKWSNAESEVVRQFQDRSMDEHAVYIVQTNQGERRVLHPKSTRYLGHGHPEV